LKVFQFGKREEEDGREGGLEQPSAKGGIFLPKEKTLQIKREKGREGPSNIPLRNDSDLSREGKKKKERWGSGGKGGS